jgi:hypothetical protein
MDRRAFLETLTLGILAAPLVGEAQRTSSHKSDVRPFRSAIGVFDV